MPGHKDDAGKPRMDLLPPDALLGAAAVFGFGAAKYSDRNWEQGIETGRLFAAVQRHMWQWWNGEDRDGETDLPHLDHALCTLMMLRATAARGLAEDTRPYALMQPAPPAPPPQPEPPKTRTGAECPHCGVDTPCLPSRHASWCPSANKSNS